MKKAAKVVNKHNHLYLVNSTMQDELIFISHALLPKSGIKFETPIAHLIPRMPTASIIGDSLLVACGGYSITIEFWGHFLFPKEVVTQTLLHLKENSEKRFILINCLKYVTIILNYCASLVTFATCKINDDQHPVVLCVTNNTSTLNWTLHTSKKSIIGSALARFFCSLLFGLNVGVNTKWISTTENTIANKILRLKAGIDTNFNSFPYLRLCRPPTGTCGVESLCFLPAESQAALIDLGNIVDTKMARRKSDSELETARFGQAVYIKFCKSKNIPDPCGNQAGYERIIACFIEQLMLDHNSCSATVFGYIEAINTLFCLRHFDIPTDLSTVQTCVSRSSMQGKEKKRLLGKGAPSHVRCLLPCSIWPRSCQLIQSKLLLQTGLSSSESLVYVVLNMHRKHSQHSTSTNTLRANVSSKPSSQLTGNSMTAAALSSLFTH